MTPKRYVFVSIFLINKSNQKEELLFLKTAYSGHRPSSAPWEKCMIGPSFALFQARLVDTLVNCSGKQDKRNLVKT